MSSVNLERGKLLPRERWECCWTRDPTFSKSPSGRHRDGRRNSGARVIGGSVSLGTRVHDYRQRGNCEGRFNR